MITQVVIHKGELEPLAEHSKEHSDEISVLEVFLVVGELVGGGGVIGGGVVVSSC